MNCDNHQAQSRPMERSSSWRERPSIGQEQVLSTVKADRSSPRRPDKSTISRRTIKTHQALAKCATVFVAIELDGSRAPRSGHARELSPYCQGGRRWARIDGAKRNARGIRPSTIAMCCTSCDQGGQIRGAAWPGGSRSNEWSRATDDGFVLRLDRERRAAGRGRDTPGFVGTARHGGHVGPLKGRNRKPFDWRPERPGL